VRGDEVAHQREPEADAAGAVPVAAGAAAEAFEDAVAVLDRHPGSAVVDHEPHLAHRLVPAEPGSRGHPHLGDAAAVADGVLDEVGEHPLQASLVAGDRCGGDGGVDLDRDVGQQGQRRRGEHQAGQSDRLPVEGVTGVEAADLEQVLHEHREAVDLVAEQVERGLAAAVELVAPSAQHRERGRQGRQRGP
jgi:hypothetical protein